MVSPEGGGLFATSKMPTCFDLRFWGLNSLARVLTLITHQSTLSLLPLFPSLIPPLAGVLPVLRWRTCTPGNEHLV